MSTRQRRHGGNRQRAWESLNGTFGLDGNMESSTWFVALQDPDNAEQVLIDHYGSLQGAQRAFKAFDEAVAQRFEKVAERVFQVD